MKKTLGLLLIFLGLFAGKLYANDTIFMTWRAFLGEEKTIRLGGTEGGTFCVDWGDGSDTVLIGTDEYYDWTYGHSLQHNYAENGTYDVTIVSAAQEARIHRFGCGSGNSWAKRNGVIFLDVSKSTALTHLDCMGNYLTALDVSQNSALVDLYCGYNQLKSLDVSNNTALTDLDCGSNQLKSLDVSNNTALTDLNCGSNQLTSLDLSQNSNLQRFYGAWNNPPFRLSQDRTFDMALLPGMDVSRIDSVIGGTLEGTLLHVENNEVRYKYKTGNVKAEFAFADFSLEWTDRIYTSFSIPDGPVVKGCPLTLSCNVRDAAIYYTTDGSTPTAGSTRYTLPISLDSAMTIRAVSIWEDCQSEIREASYTINKKTACDTIRFTWLTNAMERKEFVVRGMNGGRFAIDWGDGSRLQFVELMNDFESLYYTYTDDDSAHTVLIYGLEMMAEIFHFYGDGCRITEWSMSRNTPLRELACFDNQLTELNLNGCDALVYLWCWNNQLTELDLNGCDALVTLSCHTNQLTSLDVTRSLQLEELYCYGNLLEQLDVSRNTNLRLLYCHTNQLTSLDVTKNLQLEGLYCGVNQLTSLDVSHNPNLMTLYCNNNRLTSLVTQNAALTSLVCYGNRLEKLDVTRNLLLEGLYCQHNRLSSLDISKNVALSVLSCAGNRLDSLDVRGNTALRTLNCSRNRLGSLSVSDTVSFDRLACDSNALPLSRLSDLKVGISSGNGFCASPQRIGMRLETGRVLDLSAEMRLRNTETDYTVLKDGAVLTDTALYTLTASGAQGHLMFKAPGEYLLCLSNAAVTETHRYDSLWNGGPGHDTPKPVDVYYSFTVTGDPLSPPEPSLTPCDTLRFTWKTVEKDKTFRFTGLEGQFVVDWGDTQRDTIEASGEQWSSISHIYTDDDTLYNVLMCGMKPYAQIDRLSFSININESVQLTALDVSGCTALTSLICYNNQLTSLDLSNNTALTTLNCWGNQLTSLNISGCKALTHLICMDNQLTNLDVSRNPALTRLDCGENQLTELDVSNNPVLSTLICRRNQLRTLDLSAHTDLTHVLCYDNQLTSLNVNGCTSLRHLECYSNQLTTLDVRGCVSLAVLDCRNNQLPVLDVSENPALRHLDCGYNHQLSMLDVSKNTALQRLNCIAANQLSMLDVSKNTALQHLNCVANRLSVLDVSKNTVLQHLECGVNQLSMLDISKNTALQHLECGDNQLSMLDVSKNTALQYLDCGSNQLSTLDVSKNTALQHLNCGSNQLRELDLKKNAALQILSCDMNQFIALDVSQNTALTTLACSENMLTDLDVRQNMALENFTCGYNQLTSLDVSANTALTSLDGKGNYRAVKLTAERTFDMASLPGMDIAKVKSVIGGSLDGTQLHFDSDMPCYWYEVSGKDSVLFHLIDDRATALADTICFAWDVKAGEEQTISFTGMGGRFAIDWGDGSEQDTVSVEHEVSHKYEKIGNYQTTVNGLDADAQMLRLGFSTFASENSGLTSLDVSECAALWYLNCTENLLKILDVSKNSALTHLYCYDNQLTNLDVSQNPVLYVLSCFNNQLTSLDVSKNSALTYLYCYNNQLTALDVIQNPALQHLSCSNNQLTALDVSQNTALIVLECSYNQLTSLDLSKNLVLNYLNCSGNSRAVPLSDDRTFDVDSLPGMNVGNVESIENGTLDGTLLRFGTDTIYYKYQTGNDRFPTVNFTLTSKVEPVIPDTIYAGNGVGWKWIAVAGEEKEIAYKGTGKGFRVDWGDGSTSDGKGSSNNGEAAPKDSEKEFRHRYATAGVYTVKLEPLNGNGRLTMLDVSDGRVISLAFGDASMLEELDCSENLLTGLELSDAAKLKDLDCSENLLAELDLSGCAQLQEADFSENRLMEVGLPTHAGLKEVDGEGNRLRLSTLHDILLQRVSGATYGFDPQGDSVRLGMNESLDLSSEMQIGGRSTTYTLRYAEGSMVSPSDYTEVGGVFRFMSLGRYRLALENAAVVEYKDGRARKAISFVWNVEVSGVGNGLQGWSTDPVVYARNHTIYVRETEGEVEVYSMLGQRIYRGLEREIPVDASGIYIVRVGTYRCKLVVR